MRHPGRSGWPVRIAQAVGDDGGNDGGNDGRSRRLKWVRTVPRPGRKAPDERAPATTQSQEPPP
ncbi:hypothetical protein [Azospirillum largimobile]